MKKKYLVTGTAEVKVTVIAESHAEANAHVANMHLLPSNWEWVPGGVTVTEVE
jgi:hypothetical protein